jgi:hypothetical protein
MMTESEWVVLQTYLTTELAEVDRAVLEGNGIEVVVQADDIGGMMPGIASFGGARLQVHREDTERALDLLNLPPAE